MMHRAGLVCLVLITGCVPIDEDSGQAFTLDPRGIQPLGTDLRIDFGRAQTGVIDTVSGLQTRPPAQVAVLEECGAGEVTAAIWPDGLVLNFLDGDFLGWVIDQNGFVTGTGLEVGQSREVLPVTGFEETSLGTEFEAQGIFGLLDEQHQDIALLWSGVTCFFR